MSKIIGIDLGTTNRCLCERLAVIDHGRLIAYGPVDEVLGDGGNEYIRRYSSKWDALSTLTPFGDD